MGRNNQKRKGTSKPAPYMRQHRKAAGEERRERGDDRDYHHTKKSAEFTVVRESEKFNAYYKELGIVPEDEWDAFVTALKQVQYFLCILITLVHRLAALSLSRVSASFTCQDLPIAFRITTNGYHKFIKERLNVSVLPVAAFAAFVAFAAFAGLTP